MILNKLRTVVGEKDVLYKQVDLATYRDSVHLSGLQPTAVVFPKDTGEVSEVLKILHQYQVPVIARGAGTNLCGDTLSLDLCIILELAKMDRILEVNIIDRYVEVEPGVTNMEVQNILKPHGYFFAPDPASMGVSTIGGNIGENAGGMRCVKYGVTTDNVIGLEIVLSDGQVILSNGPLDGDFGYNLTGLMNGSEGTLGVITKAWLRIVKLPDEVKTLVAVYANLEDAAKTVSQIIGKGIIPGALEMIDHLAIEALEENMNLGYPIEAEAVLLIEIDGFSGTLESQVERVLSICKENNATEIRVAKTEEERQQLWLGRREALNCFVSKMPTYAQEDVAVPRTKLPEVLEIIKKIGEKYSLVIASVCHAGDGNLHPTIIYDDKDEEQTKQAHFAFGEMMEQAIALGGTITGEHGVGIEKLKGMNLLFSEDELSFMWQLKLAFDPKKILNPGKVIPDTISRMMLEDLEQVPESKEVSTTRELFFADLEREEIGEILINEKILAAYSLEGNKSWCAIRPKTVTEVAAIVRLATKYDIKILPWGRGTKVSIGTHSKPFDIVVDMSGLNKIIEIDTENLTATVEAGIEFKDFQEELYKKGYMLSIDPLESGSPTIGGIVATNSTGTLRLKYSSLKNIVLGLDAVISGGKIIHYGGKMIKNVAGYDLRKLFVGSWGTLGIITKITLKLSPLPEKAVYRTFMTDDYSAFADYLFAVQKKDVQLTSFDIFVENSKYYINLCMSGQHRSVDRQLEILDEIEINKLALIDEVQDPYFIAGKSFFNKYIQPNQSNKIVIKSSIRFSDITAWIKKIQSINQGEGSYVFGNAASGILYATFFGENISLTDLISDVKACSKNALTFGVHTLEIGPEMSSISKEEKSSVSIYLHLKEMLDPKAIFSPGRTIGGRSI